MTDNDIQVFREAVWAHYAKNARSMPWRDHPTPYNVLVSELMLQQTQVNRVLPKFQEFTQRFPDFAALAQASLADVLSAWNGLGYNRRAKFLHQAAQQIVKDFDGILPDTIVDLTKLPGIGPNTAGAILAYVYNQPVIFIETNIRSVCFYHFFADKEQVTDVELRDIVAKTLDTENPREWYWALMDYGTFLKQTRGNNIAQSRHYTKQSKFQGSRRQIRGEIIRLLLDGAVKENEIRTKIADERVAGIIEDLLAEALIMRKNATLRLTDNRELP